jgi:hypothetical protein
VGVTTIAWRGSPRLMAVPKSIRGETLKGMGSVVPNFELYTSFIDLLILGDLNRCTSIVSVVDGDW